MEHSSLHQRAQVLLRKVVQGYQNHTQDSHTLSIYDTAWVSMIAKTVNEEPRWAFPECFQFILDEQQPDGGWDGQKDSDDGILNTLAALVAMKKHEKSTYIAAPIADLDLHTRLSKAITYLQGKLQQWDLRAGVHVGFEILVPTLLSILEHDQVVFQFPQKQDLMRLNAKKLRHFDPSMLYGNQKTTSLYSLEAFIGKIDFDKVQHHKTNGSLMSSPASTAAYLMNCSTWDMEAEMYIKNAIMHGRGHGNGGVPSVYPCNIFEVTWVSNRSHASATTGNGNMALIQIKVISTLVHAGYTTESLDHQNVSEIVSYLEAHFSAQEGLLGFGWYSQQLRLIQRLTCSSRTAPSELADVDDTAKTVFTLNLLGRPTSPEQMISFFKADSGHLMTYRGERDPGYSANCNGLMSILSAPDVDRYLLHIESIANFLCTSYLSGTFKDKWNTSSHYSMMLLAEALMRLIQLWSDGSLELLPQNLVQDRVLVVLIQILNRTLLTQHTDGNWSPDNSPEVNAYGILTLLALQHLPHARPLASKIQSAIQAGRQVLIQTERQWQEPQYLWVGKITYGSSILTEAYCLAAMYAPCSHHVWSDRIEKTVTTTGTDVMSLSRFFQRIPEYSDTPGWKILASVIEGSLYLQKLRVVQCEIFPHQQSSKDKYLDYIPCSWTIVNNCTGVFLDSTLMWDMMMMISMLDFLVDEYMESVVAQLRESDIVSLQQIVRALCRKPDVGSPIKMSLPHQTGHLAPLSSGTDHESSPAESPNGYSKQPTAVEGVISSYVRAMVEHPRIQKASSADRTWLQAELETFLLSHIDQIQDNRRFHSQDSPSLDTIKPFQTPRTNHYLWSHTTAANHTSCAVSFAFYACCLASDSNTGAADLFSTAYSKYMARDLCSHLAVMTRLYNDYSSLARDRAESNLNSVNFPEFHSERAGDAGLADPSPISTEVRAKECLLRLARYERSCVKKSFQAVVEALGEDTASGMRLRDSLKLFVGVTSLWADMYVAKDLMDRMR